MFLDVCYEHFNRFLTEKYVLFNPLINFSFNP